MGSLNLPGSGEVYVDTSIVIYGVEKVKPYAQLLEPLWSALRTGAVTLVTSELTWLETLVKPFRDGNTGLEQLFRDFLTAREVRLVPADLGLWERAAQLRPLGLRTPDALHAATALEARCSRFLTNDPIFVRVAGLPVAVLKDLLPP